MTKEVIATDVDDVLFPFVTEFSQWHNYEYGTSISLKDFKSYKFEEVLKISVPEMVHRITLFTDLDHRHLTVDPVKDSREAINALSEDYKLVAITARHPNLRSATSTYLEEHFEGIFGDITLVGHKDTVNDCKTKAEICRNFGAIALIDDSIEHVTICTESEMQGILFGDYPWQLQRLIPGDVTRCFDWGEVLEHFNE